MYRGPEHKHIPQHEETKIPTSDMRELPFEYGVTLTLAAYGILLKQVHYVL